jgi:two-component system sensor histidine kinase KdpD
MSAGVGKTCAMLEEAHRAIASGRSVVAAVLETHSRPYTMARSQGIPTVSPTTIPVGNHEVYEIDEEAVRATGAEIILVDELAHRNAPGMRHERRWQDVEDLLRDGFDVWATVNVQHFESVADAVEAATRITVSERVPDALLDKATTVELIDVSPERLRQRLLDGDIYGKERGKVAAEGFFTLDNLRVLRERALRVVADRVDADVAMMRAGRWRRKPRILVAIRPGATTKRLITEARTLAAERHGEWMAIAVRPETGWTEGDEQAILNDAHMVRHLSGTFATVNAHSVLQGIIDAAQRFSATDIVIGRSTTAVPSILTGLVAADLHASIIVLRTNPPTKGPQPNDGRKEPATVRDWILISSVLLITTTLLLVAEDHVGYRGAGGILLLQSLVASWYVSRRAALTSAIASALVWNLLFIPPRFSLSITALEDLLLFVAFFVGSGIASVKTAQHRARMRHLQHRERQAESMYHYASLASSATTQADLISLTVPFVAEALHATIAVVCKGAMGDPDVPEGNRWRPDTAELELAAWVLRSGSVAGRGTFTLASGTATCYPAAYAGVTRAALLVRRDDQPRIGDDEAEFLQRIAATLAAAMHRLDLDRMRHEADLARRLADTSTGLLNAVSHELRTPLARILGATSTIRGFRVSAADREELLADIEVATQDLNTIVGDLLDVSRIREGILCVRRAIHNIRGLLNDAIRRTHGRNSPNVTIAIEAPDELYASVDAELLLRVLTNVLANAARHARSNVTITAHQDQMTLTITVADDGPGFPAAMVEHAVQPFHTDQDVVGLGLGLVLSTSFIHAHDGMLTLRNASSGGALVIIRIPVMASNDDDPDC